MEKIEDVSVPTLSIEILPFRFEWNLQTDGLTCTDELYLSRTETELAGSDEEIRTSGDFIIADRVSRFEIGGIETMGIFFVSTLG